MEDRSGLQMEPTSQRPSQTVVVEIEGEVPFSVFLSIIEIARIYYFIGLTEKQERIKDLFVV